MTLAILILIVVTYFKWMRSLLVCLLCYIALPMETNYDAEMFFIVWAIFGTMISLPWNFWAGFGVGFLVGKR